MIRIPGYLLIVLCFATAAGAQAQTTGVQVARKTPMVLPAQVLDRVPYTVQGADTVYRTDFRHTDLRNCDLTPHFSLLLKSGFDSRTLWPKSGLPPHFKPEVISVFSRDPGLGIRSAGAKGYTAKNAGIAVIGPPALVQHEEFKHRLKHYEEFGGVSDTASADGTAWAGMIAGKTTGIAFESWLYYFAVPCMATDSGAVYSTEHLIAALERIAELNNSLPAHQKIAAAALPCMIDKTHTQYEELIEQYSQLIDGGIVPFDREFTAFGGSQTVYGLGRDPLRNPEDYEFFRPAAYWYPQYKAVLSDTTRKLFIPLESRYVAASTGHSEYVFMRYPDRSYLVPFIAAVYALVKTADPGMNPQDFCNGLYQTGMTVNIKDKEGGAYNIRAIPNLPAFFERRQNTSK